MRLYAWGANSYGQLGLGSKGESVLEPQEVRLDDSLLAENIVEICGGVGHTLALDMNGHVYSCGWNAKGQLGIFGDTLHFKKVEVLAAQHITRISCGWDSSAAVNKVGDMLFWGNLANLQISCPENFRFSPRTATKVPASQVGHCGISKIAWGKGHMAALTNGGRMLGTSSKGALGTGTGSQGALAMSNNNADLESKLMWDMPNVEEVRDIACGHNHTVCLKAGGTVLCWGANRHGQLGMDPARGNVFVPTEVFSRAGLVSVAAGCTHTVALSSDGKIFNWGRNNLGQLGAVREETHLAKQLTDIGTVAQITCGWQHTLARTIDAKLFAWGSNEHGSCGTANAAIVTKPIQLFAGHNVKVAFACAGQSFAVVE